MLAAAAVAAALAPAPLPAQEAAPAADAPPPLVVHLTVDQLLPAYFDRWGDQLTGGLARLAREGAFFTRAYQDHAITETAPGHASTLSGRFPRSTGIVRNAAGVQDPQAPLIGGDGGWGASPFRFRGGTLIDWMRRADPRSRALSVSRKDRGAILPLGRAKQQVFWYDYAGRFTTSDYYADTLPTWVTRFNERRLPARMAGEAWTPLLSRDAYPEPDSVPAEGAGRGFLFPHVLPKDPDEAARAIAEFPWMDRMTLDLALEGVRETGLGAGPQTDLLAVSLSTMDAVGHRFGPDSREAHDHFLRLDRMLGEFLDSLAVLRPEGFVVSLTADHGVASFPEVRPGGAAGAAMHLDREPLRAWLAGALGMHDLDSTAVVFADELVLVDRDAFARAGPVADTLLAGFVAFARTQPGVMRAWLRSDLARADTASDPIAARWARMLPPDEPVGAVITLEPGWVWGRADYAQHGSPHDYDAHVPLILWGAPFRPGRYDGVARVVDLAPTLAEVIGVEPTEPLDGRVLTEALR